MGFAKVFRFIGIIIGLPMAFYGFIVRFPQWSGNLAEKIGIIVDENTYAGGLPVLIFGGLLLLVGIICLIATISNASFERDMRANRGTISVRAGAGKDYKRYVRKYKKVLIDVAKEARANVVNNEYTCNITVHSSSTARFNIDFAFYITGQKPTQDAVNRLQNYIVNALSRRNVIKESCTISVEVNSTNYVKRY